MDKILIVEDDPVARDIVASMIETIGKVPVMSPNGRHAYETLQVNQDVKLLICDVMLPEMKGTDLVKTLRATTDFADLPIIIVSSIIGVNDIAGLLDLGATLFQPKPINEDLLQKNMSLCLKERIS